MGWEVENQQIGRFFSLDNWKYPKKLARDMHFESLLKNYEKEFEKKIDFMKKIFSMKSNFTWLLALRADKKCYSARRADKKCYRPGEPFHEKEFFRETVISRKKLQNLNKNFFVKWLSGPCNTFYRPGGPRNTFYRPGGPIIINL